MTNNDFKNEKDLTIKDSKINSNNNLFNSEFILLLLILLIFFNNNNIFNSYFQLLNNKIKQVKNYLDIADTTIQTLNQASQIPQQMIK